MSYWEKILGKIRPSEKDRLFGEAIARIVGTKPRNLDLFKLATLHSSVGKITENGFKENNERLEFLGDATLSMVIAEYLYHKYPFEDEGFLTEIRSRIVKRETLNEIADKLGIPGLVDLQDKNQKRGNSIYGNALEAVIGAVFLDRGYIFCREFILNQIVNRHLDIQQIINTDSNFKSKIIEWAQKENKEIEFESVTPTNIPAYHEFEVDLMLNKQHFSSGTGTSKKRAEQDAALKACEKLKLL